jgi:acyl dehydratase|tara:strand:- start:3823 stop:4944 length:1122 start_codon:yes stop_codon:yes gene_type:complete
VNTTATITTEITDEASAKLASLVGSEPQDTLTEYRPPTPIKRSQIRHWAVMSGDMRPLFLDLDYAEESPWKTIIAPQSVILHEERFDPEIDGLPGCKSVLSAAEIDWQQPIRMGDTLVSKTTVVDVQETATAAEGRTVTVVTDTVVNNPDGESIGNVLLTWDCYERGSAAHRGLYGERSAPHEYSEDDIDAIGAEYKEEQPRGADSLTGDAVSIGDELPCVLKGPTTRERYLTPGLIRWFWGHAQGVELQKKAPELFFQNENDAPEPIAGIDSSHHRAQRWGGLPGVLEVNGERVHWLVHLLMNWMGDAGFITHLSLTFPRSNMVGDITRSYGSVTAKNLDEGRAIVDLDVWQENQLGERVTEGTAQVAVPVT